MRRIIPFFLLGLSLFAQDVKTAEEIQQELNEAEAQFEQAKKMFNPWYAGPLVTPSPSLMPVGDVMDQTYLFITGNYASFNKDRKSISLEHNSYSAKALTVIQTGVTSSTDFILTPAGQMSWSEHKNGGGFSDLSATFGFQICPETLYVPKFKFSIAETFPTGKYKHLSTNGLGLNSTGGGSYQTQFGLGAGKVIWWTYPYPMNTRIFLGYTLSTTVPVSEFNTYGGGFGTKGKVRPGNIFTADFGWEVSFSQRWVFALDIVYVAQNRTKFHGTPGVTKTGATATVGSPYNDNLSLAPALEYNFSDVFSILWGAQFSVYGRNSLNFVNGQFSVEYTW